MITTTAMTNQLDKLLIECARKQNDGKILAVLNGGDVVAQYHYFCLTALYNKERAYLLTIENHDDSELSQEREVYLFVFSGLLTYIIKTHMTFNASSSNLAFSIV
jgi:hypothetical protein